MSTHDDDQASHDQVPRDDMLRALYRQLPADAPRAEIDDAIRAAARREAGAQPAAAPSSPLRRMLRWQVPLAAAATVLLTVVILRDEPVQQATLNKYEPPLPAAVRDEAQPAPQSVPVPALPAKKDVAAPAVHGDRLPEVARRAVVPATPEAKSNEIPAPARESPVVVVAPSAPAEALSAPAAGRIVARDTGEADRRMPAGDAPLAKAGSVGRAADSLAAAGTAVAGKAEQAATGDWPLMEVPGATIVQGPLAGLVLVARTAIGDDNSETIFVVRGDGLSATALGARVDRQLRSSGWQAVRHCDQDPALRYLRDARQVLLRGLGTDRLEVRVGAEQPCG